MNARRAPATALNRPFKTGVFIAVTALSSRFGPTTAVGLDESVTPRFDRRMTSGSDDTAMVAVEPAYCHQCGEELVVKPIHGRERKVCPACEYIHFENAVPSVTVIVRDGTDVLLMEPFARDGWELPGGHPEIEEEPVEAAARELAEETGVEAMPADLTLLSVVHGTEQELHYNMITYVVDYQVTDGSVTPGEEATDVTFWSLDRILSSPAETRQVDRRVIRLEFDR